MSQRPKYVVPWKTAHHEIRQRAVGGKALNLFKLRSCGFPVPPFCVVPTSVFEQALSSREPEIKAGLRNLTARSVEEIERFSQSLRDFIGGIQFSNEFCREVRRELASLVGQDGLFAVRSSVIGEDALRNSFAGQMDSFLAVPETHLFEAIKKVWASTFSPRALLYRREKRLGGQGVAAAVIIQGMVTSVASGILFTRDPEGRDRECVISAAFGLGEGVVLNRVESDTYRIPWHGEVIAKKIAIKDCRVTGKRQAQGGTAVESLPETMKRRPVLTEAQVRSLRDIGVKAERSFGFPLDIEWAFDSQGKLFILQARPVVFTEKIPSPVVRNVWDNSNIVESYPGLTLPLTFSFVRQCYEVSLRKAAWRLTLARKTLQFKPDIFPNMIGLIDGRIYYNLLNWYRMEACFPGFNRYKTSWDRMIGISQNTPFSGHRFSLLHGLSSTLKLCWLMLAVKQTSRKFFRFFNRAYDKFKDVDFNRAAEHELPSIYEALNREFGGKWYLTLYNDFCAIKYYDWLKTLCAKWTDEETGNLQNKLLCGVRGMESVAPVRALARLAETARSESDSRSLFDKDDRQIWRDIQQDPALAPLKSALAVYLEAYGDRTLEELKLEQTTLREDPSQLIKLIRNFLNLSSIPEFMDLKDQRTRRETEEALKSHLKNPLKRLAFAFVLRNTRRAVAQRENMRFARTRLFGIARRLVRRLGRLLEVNGFLDNASDIHYLTLEEAFGLIQGTAVTQNLRTLVALRKAEYERFAQKSPPSRFETTGIPCLHSACEEKARGDVNKTLKGTPCSSGRVRGTARIVTDPRLVKENASCILVAQSTDPGWVFLMISAKGIVTERGSVLSHTAIIGRELGIPTIVGVKDATKLIPDGASLYIDGGTGDVQWQ
jgi:pyruvate,water dikinase